MDHKQVEVIYALPDEQTIVCVDHAPGMTALDAVKRSHLLECYPDIDTANIVLGRFGKRIEPGESLEPGDRVEICRPLKCDPREKRKELLQHGHVMGQRR